MISAVWLETPWFWLCCSLLAASLFCGSRRWWGLSLLPLTLLLALLYAWLSPALFPPAWFASLSPQTSLWIRGDIAAYSVQQNEVSLHLKNVHALSRTESFALLEAHVRFAKQGRIPRLYFGKTVQVGGRLAHKQLHSVTWHLQFAEGATLRSFSQAPAAWERHLEHLRLRWQTRAAFFLAPEPLSIFLPLTLAERTRYRPSAQLFQETGMAHVLAISGLHIGLIYVLLSLLGRGVGWCAPLLWETRWFPELARWLPVVLLWGYVTLLAFPVSALRAVTMITIWLLLQQTGRRLPATFSLLLTSALFLALDWNTVQSVSFQLSFVAVASILLLMPWNLRRPQTRAQLLRRYVLDSTGVTLAVTIGTLPILLHTFGLVSLEGFWLNLVLLPLLAFWVLPLCLLTFVWSGVHLGSPPNVAGEAELYALVGWSLERWLWFLEELQLPAGRIIVRGEWSVEMWVGYYGVVGLAWWMTRRRDRLRALRRAEEPSP